MKNSPVSGEFLVTASAVGRDRTMFCPYPARGTPAPTKKPDIVRFSLIYFPATSNVTTQLAADVPSTGTKHHAPTMFFPTFLTEYFKYGKSGTSSVTIIGDIGYSVM